MTRLTEVAQQRVAEVLRPGEFAIDATAGNGHDTAFLAQCVGPNGRVFAFDVQAAAIAATRQRLEKLGQQNVDLVQRSHADLEDALSPDVRGQVGAVMFNLGYLPGSDHAVVTETAATQTALDASLRVLRSGGIVTIVAYPGHAGGAAETAAVASQLQELDTDALTVERIDGTSGRNVSPVLFVVTQRT